MRCRRLAAVVKDSNDAVTVHDFDGNITEWNKGAEKMYGYSEDEALKMNVCDIVPQDQRKAALAFIKKLREDNVESFETQRITKDGKRLDVWLTVTRLAGDDGKPVAIATTERDITGRK
jgi:two-component system, chemotaxis family, CheB/CheR fusion protein